MVTVAPLLEFIQPRYGLLNSVPVETIADKHWQDGGIETIDYLAAPCGPASVYPLSSCDPLTGLPVDRYGAGKPLSTMETVTACGHEVVFGAECSARTLNDPDYDIRGQAERGLIAKESQALEKAFWDNDPVCYTVDDLTPATGPVKAIQAIAALENAMVECSGLGYIHVPAALVPHMGDAVNQVQGVLRTKAGSVVIVGAGYGDANNTAGDGTSTRILGSGQIRIFKGDLRFSPDVAKARSLAAVNSGQNVVEWRAERSWALGVDPCCNVFSVDAQFC